MATSPGGAHLLEVGFGTGAVDVVSRPRDIDNQALSVSILDVSAVLVSMKLHSAELIQGGCFLGICAPWEGSPGTI